MAYWNEKQYRIITHKPLPEETISILYSINDVHKALDAGEDPVEISIKKWQKFLEVYNHISEYKNPYLYYGDIHKLIGYKTCSLCIISIRKFESEHGIRKYKEDKCTVCPLSKIDRCIDENSTFAQIDDILSRKIELNEGIRNRETLLKKHEELGSLIQKFIDLLHQLK